MTREEMLKKLHTIKPGVELTALPNEGALECEYVTKEGCSYEWIGMYDWPVVMVSNIQQTSFARIKEKLILDSLTFDDIEETQFYNLFFGFIEQDSINETNADAVEILNDAFKSLQNVELGESGELFAIFDSCSAKPIFDFFSDYESMAIAFGDSYIGVNTKWEELSDEELEQWLDRLEYDFQNIPFGQFNTEIGEE